MSVKLEVFPAPPKPTGEPAKVRDGDLELFKKQNGLWLL
jgi:hypothetical protein